MDFNAAAAATRAADGQAVDSGIQALPSSSPTPPAAADQLGLVTTMPMQLGMPPEVNLAASQMDLCAKSSPTAAEMEGWETILQAPQNHLAHSRHATRSEQATADR